MKKNRANFSVFTAIVAAIFFAVSVTSVYAQIGYIYFQGFGILDGRSSPPFYQLASDFKVTFYYGLSPFSMTAGPTVKNSSPGTYYGGPAPDYALALSPPFYGGTWTYIQIKAWSPSTYSSYDAAAASGNPNVILYSSPVNAYQLGYDDFNAPYPYELDNFKMMPIALPTGSLQVTISPSGAVSAGAQWRVDSGVWRSSGATATGLLAGSHTISYSTVTGWTTPTSQTANISSGATTSITGIYMQQTGAIKISLLPTEAVVSGARWRVDAGSWQTNDAVVNNIPIGNHTVNFSTVGGWIAPTSQITSVNNSTTNTITANYQMSVTIDAISTDINGTSGFSFALSGTTNKSVVVEVSNDLATWHPLKTNLLVNGVVQVQDFSATNYTERYYRAKILP